MWNLVRVHMLFFGHLSFINCYTLQLEMSLVSISGAIKRKIICRLVSLFCHVMPGAFKPCVGASVRKCVVCLYSSVSIMQLPRETCLGSTISVLQNGPVQPIHCWRGLVVGRTPVVERTFDQLRNVVCTQSYHRHWDET